MLICQDYEGLLVYKEGQYYLKVVGETEELASFFRIASYDLERLKITKQAEQKAKATCFIYQEQSAQSLGFAGYVYPASLALVLT